MKYPMYCIRDKKASWEAPQCQLNEQTAVRNFAFRLALPQSEIGFAPQDYDLYEVASFDIDKCILDPLPVPVFVCSALDAISMYGKD